MTEAVGRDETLDILCEDRLQIIQRRDGYRFSIDAILLANFVTLKKHERLLDIGSGCGIMPIYMSKKGYVNAMLGVEIQKDLYDASLRNKTLNYLRQRRLHLRRHNLMGSNIKEVSIPRCYLESSLYKGTDREKEPLPFKACGQV